MPMPCRRIRDVSNVHVDTVGRLYNLRSLFPLQ